jgi:hypothetical protein
MSREINSKPPKTLGKTILIESATKADVDQEAIKDRLLEVLRRESVNLIAESSEGRLDRDRSVALVNYLKFLSKLEEEQADKLSDLSDEDLRRAKDES